MYMKKLFLLISFFSIIANAQTARGVKIGYIDMEYILEKVPDYADAMSWTAYNYRTSGDYPRGIALYQDVIDLNPPAKVQVRCLAGIAQAYARMGNDAKMQETMDALISKYKVSQSDGVAFYVFGIGEDYYYMAQDAAKVGDPNTAQSNYKKALAVWKQFEEAVPTHNSPQYVFGRGVVCKELQDYQDAIRHLSRLVTKWPAYEKSDSACLLLAQCYEYMAKKGLLTEEQKQVPPSQFYQMVIQKYPLSEAAEIAKSKSNR